MTFLTKIFTSKSFGFLAILFIVGTALLVLGKLASTDWLELMKWLGLTAGARSAIGDFSNQNAQIEAKKGEIDKSLDADTDSELAGAVVDRTNKP